ncbi:hypothetical protein Poli38472_013164 [Pythium oligandrum]|uniref:Uncharacterized protein n=1 Tax=Pythium oligandrum TaxID=41045 RepID=A0A8K1FDW3_PYTOL|nr:hypothetical protein Poli38472_013164 [Pythium oligandrum]|eukprot:TMW55273.1 hypothetical protein Poli38472_013164 [Pythium oligandrum]
MPHDDEIQNGFGQGGSDEDGSDEDRSDEDEYAEQYELFPRHRAHKTPVPQDIAEIAQAIQAQCIAIVTESFGIDRDYPNAKAFKAEYEAYIDRNLLPYRVRTSNSVAGYNNTRDRQRKEAKKPATKFSKLASNREAKTWEFREPSSIQIATQESPQRQFEKEILGSSEQRMSDSNTITRFTTPKRRHIAALQYQSEIVVAQVECSNPNDRFHRARCCCVVLDLVLSGRLSSL